MPFLPLPKLRSELVQVARRLHQNGWVANHDGNVSARLKGGRLLITCTAISKHDVDEASLLVVDMEGKVLEGRRKPFSELELHLAAYRARPEVDAVLHAHPPHATALGLCGGELAPVAMPEVVVSLGSRIPTVPRFLPRDAEGLGLFAAQCAEYDAVLLSGNGVFTLGADLSQSLLRMELVEHYARILAVARLWGPVPPLSAPEVEKLLEARKKAGLGPRK
ncbi:MAG: class II aldolase/adducin family protein [Myxococcales bacterium]|nr:class II aldolase/adducin family protein [Myxococcales bacterium]